MKTKTIMGWVVWTRDTTPMEEGWAAVHVAKADAVDQLKNQYPTSWKNELWRVAPVTMTCEVPCKPVKSKPKGKKR